MIIEQIVSYMERNHINQDAICQKTGLSPNCLQFAVQGKQNLSIDDYEKICLALEVPYGFFFTQNQPTL